jgi:hypothetical protein
MVSDNFYRVIYSDMQTQKTPIISMICIFIILFLKIKVVLFVQNRKADLFQLISRLNYILSSEKDVKKTVFNNLKISLFNSREVKKLIDTFQDEKYCIILDECDFLDSGNFNQTTFLFETLFENAEFIQNISATPLTTLFFRKCYKKDFVCIPSPENYRGLQHITWVNLNQKSYACNSIKDNPMEKDKNLIPFLEKFHKKKCYIDSVSGEKIPRYLLMRLGKTIDPQLKIASLVNKRYPQTIVITWNGGDKGTTIRSDVLPSESIMIKNAHTVFSKGVHYIKNIHIGTLISYLNESELDIEKIIVFAGVMADRGITFGADNFNHCKKNGKAWWHLTDMYYIASKDKSIQNLSNILQTCGRICGVYNDNIPLKIYSNWVEGIRSAYLLEQEIIDRINQLHDNDIIQEELSYLKISKVKKINKVRLCNASVKDKIDWIKENDEEFGGWSDEKRNEIMPENKIIESKKDDIDSKIKISSNDMNLMWEKLIECYKRKKGKVYKIIQAFIANDFNDIEEYKLKEICSGKFQCDNYNHWDLEHSKYHILEKNGTKFSICKKVIKKLNL